MTWDEVFEVVPSLDGVMVVYYERKGNILWNVRVLRVIKRGAETDAGVPYDSSS
jgi:hypothetical protein